MKKRTLPRTAALTLSQLHAVRGGETAPPPPPKKTDQTYLIIKLETVLITG
jgi:hypothetical protein